MTRTLEAWLEYIEGIHPRSWDLGLERIGAVADRLALRTPAPTSVIVAGTNGKGSTCVCLEQVLIASGLSTGCALSPHVHRFNERVRIDGAELDDEALCAAFEIIETGRGDVPLTYFEFTTLATLYCFKQAAVDVAVLEIGLGGRLDAFNIVDGDVGVITSIGIDHTDWLGDTRERIGAEKAGILRAGQTAILGLDMPVSVVEPANRLAGEVLCAGKDIDCGMQPSGGWWLNLRGRALADLPLGNLPIVNCALSVAAADTVLAQHNGTGTSGRALACATESGLSPAPAQGLRGTASDSGALAIDQRAVRIGLQQASLPGRCEEFVVADRRWLVDVAHNPLGAHYLRDELVRRYPNTSIVAVLGTLADKDVEGLLEALDDIVERWILVGAPPPRGLTAQALAERCAGYNTLNGGCVANGLALARSLTKPGDVILAFGSFATAEAARLELLNSQESPC